jgi:ribonuclease P protein component
LQKLQSRAQFEAVLKGPVLARTANFAIHVQPMPLTSSDDQGLNPQQAALGAMVPKRWAKRAVTRNLLKRQIRASFDRHAAQLPGGLWLVRLRAGFPVAQFVSARSTALAQAARAELDGLLAQAA